MKRQTIDIQLSDEDMERLTASKPDSGVDMWLFSLRDRANVDRTQYRLMYNGEVMRQIPKS